MQVCAYKDPVQKGLCYGGFMKPIYTRGFAKPLQRGGFVYMYTHTYTCTFWSFFLQIWGILCYGGFMNPLYTRGFDMGASWSPYRKGVLQSPWGLCTDIHTHICTFQSLFLQIWGVLHYGDFTKQLYTRGFIMGAL